MFLPQVKNNKGFTLIEMLVALALFTVVITIAVGAFLSLIGGSQKVQSEQSVITTLTFVLDSMTREIRTGSGYNCRAAATLRSVDQDSAYGSSTNPCQSGATGISFLESGSSISSSADRISYYYDSTAKSIFRRVGNGSEQSIVSDGITMTDVRFFVTGTTKSDTNQPAVTIVLQAQDEEGVETTLQTTVTQRELDI